MGPDCVVHSRVTNPASSSWAARGTRSRAAGRPYSASSRIAATGGQAGQAVPGPGMVAAGRTRSRLAAERPIPSPIPPPRSHSGAAHAALSGGCVQSGEWAASSSVVLVAALLALPLPSPDPIRVRGEWDGAVGAFELCLKA